MSRFSSELKEMHERLEEIMNELNQDFWVCTDKKGREHPDCEPLSKASVNVGYAWDFLCTAYKTLEGETSNG